ASPWGGGQEPAPAPRGRAPAAPRPRASNRQSMGEAFTKSLLRQAGSTIARELMRGILGSMKKR
ncbi:helicase HerA-like domain-containing protein, partial [Phenylobacterium sp.]|uniref:helicase HerA-like domain-containing protein n=1 Tax=Phenylobacterium sp. TaxID=1871053 RepID=UPI0035ADAFB6